MSVKAVLFDLDGTLLPMEQDVFIKMYLKSLAKHMIKYGYEPNSLIKSIWAGTNDMILNNGVESNEKVFWNKFSQIYGEEKLKDESKFEEFYINEFPKLKEVCGYNPLIHELFNVIRQKGLRIVLATNPIFPKIATKQRIEWAGLNYYDFELVTTYENSKYSKPNVKYYQDIISRLGIIPEECLMVGNDVDDDMVARKIGINTFLLTECLIHKNGVSIDKYKNGNMRCLIEYIKTI
jgi:FMN phosphatase YigB (HAD superfamily)